MTYWKDAEEGDYVISSCGPLGSLTKVSVVGDYKMCMVFNGHDQEECALAWIRNRMKQESFYPAIWTMSDHGNLEPISVSI
jgi:hypothetical protein